MSFGSDLYEYANTIQKRGIRLKKWLIGLCAVSTLIWGSDAFAAAEPTNSQIKDFEMTSLIKKDNTVWVWGYLHPVPTKVSGVDHVAKVIEGYPKFVVTQDDQVYYLEDSLFTPSLQAKKAEGIEGLSEIIGHGRDLIALDKEGRLFQGNQTTDGQFSGSFTQVAGIEGIAMMGTYNGEGRDHEYISRVIFLKKDGTLWTHSDKKLQTFVRINGPQNIQSISGRTILAGDGTLWTLPDQNVDAALIAESLTPRKIEGISPIKRLQDSGWLAIDQSNRLWFLGQTVTGSSDMTTYHDLKKPLLLSGVNRVKDAAIVERSMIALTENGNVYEASIERKNMPANAKFRLLASGVTEIKAGLRHIIMKKQDGSLWGWGVNKNAELGYGDYEFMHDVPVQVGQPITVQLNGQEVAMNSGVMTRSGQSYIPVRSVFEQMGALISFDEPTKTVTIQRTSDEGKSITLKIDFKKGETWLNGTKVKQTIHPLAIQGISYLPLRFVSESLGAKVDWNPALLNISITMK